MRYAICEAKAEFTRNRGNFARRRGETVTPEKTTIHQMQQADEKGRK
jgi:hypothetical protein